MKNRFLALSCLCVVVLNLAGSALGDVRAKKKAVSPANQLAAMLPPVDGIVTIDAKRFFGEALPKVLASNQPMFEKITSMMDKVKTDVGVDVRQFEYIAVGVTAKQLAGTDYDVDPLVIARGQISSGALIGTAKLAANGKYKEEKAGDKTIYIFSTNDLASTAKQQAPAGTDPAAVDKAAAKIAKEIAVTALDANTLAIGDIALVRQALAGRPAAPSELLPLLAKKETSIVSFAGKVPTGVKGLMPLENDELGKSIDSIRYLYGSVDMAASGLTMNMTARTLQDAQAKSLLETLQGLQMVGKAILGGAKGDDKQVLARLVENVKFSAKANEVTFDLQVPQADIDLLVGKLK